jgi:hypothetical protein
MSQTPSEEAPGSAPGESHASSYTVLVYDNYHYMNQDDAPYRLGEFDTCEAAVAACMRIVDQFLNSQHKPGVTAEHLWDVYTAFGDDPGVISPDNSCHFSAWDYARQRCEEI